MKTVNLKEATRLNAILSGSIPKPDPFETALNKMGEFLFYYSVWTFVQRKQASTITEDQANLKLEQYPKMEVIFCYLTNSSSEPPAILKGRKIEKEEITGHEALSDIIYLKTGVRVPETDLMIKQIQNQSAPGEWGKKSPTERIRNLNSISLGIKPKTKPKPKTK